jgi:hypothetical protein
MLHRLKDRALSRGIAFLLNTRMERFGRVLRLELDTRSKSIEMELELRGEREPLHLRVERYIIRREGDRYLLVGEGIVTSREWINHLLETHLGEPSIEIPERYAKMLTAIV